MTSSQHPPGARRSLARVLIFIIVFGVVLGVLLRYCPYRGPVRLLVTVPTDPGSGQADLQLVFASGGSHSERFVFDRPQPVPHTLTIQWTGQKNDAASAADVRIQQLRDERRVLPASDLQLSGAQALGDGGLLLSSAGAAVTYRGAFSRITVTFAARPNSGRARILLDGQGSQVVDLYAARESDRTVTIDVPRTSSPLAATLYLPAAKATALRMTSLNNLEPMRVQSVQACVKDQTIDLPIAVRQGVTTVDLTAADIHERRIAFHPLVLTAYVLLALGGALFADMCVRRGRHARRGDTAADVSHAPTHPSQLAAPGVATDDAASQLVPAAVCGPLLVGLSAGLQVMLAAWIILGPYHDFPDAKQITDRGQHLYTPEWDLPIYIAGCAATVLVALAATWLWTRWVRRLARCLSPTALRNCVGYSFGLQVLLSMLSLACFLVLLWSRYGAFPLLLPQERTPVDIVSFCVLPAALLIVTWLELWRAGRTACRPGGATWPRALASTLCDLALPLGIITIVYIPASLWSYVAGRCTDGGMHWSYFAMNAAVAYDRGLALGTDVYSQYGLGWPLLFWSIQSIVPLAYTNMLAIGILYSCVYYVGIYVFLRLAIGSRAWAGLGTLASVLLQLFNGVGATDTPWTTPSSTCLRHPMDIWFLITLLLHLRSGRPIWALASGLICGLAIVFETETGTYLLAIFAAYLILEAWWRRSTGGARRPGGILRTWSLAAIGVLITTGGGFALASRGTFLTPAFWVGFTECLRTYAGRGASLLPLAGADASAIGLFIVMIGTGLLSATAVAAKFVFRRRVEAADVLLACVACYELGSLVLFVGRSHPYNLYHCAVPFVLTLMLATQRSARAWSEHTRGSIVPLACLCLTAAWLVTNPMFLAYPSLARTTFKPEPVHLQGVYLLAQQQDVYLPVAAATQSGEIATLGEKLDRLTADGSRVAILDNQDTLLCLASHCRPWSRYLYILTMLHTTTQLENIRTALTSDPPRYVVIQRPEERGPAPKRKVVVPPPGGEVLPSLYAAVEGLYERIDAVGPFEVWQLKK